MKMSMSDEEWFGILSILGVMTSWGIALTNPLLGASTAGVVVALILVLGNVKLSNYVDSMPSQRLLSDNQTRRIAAWGIIYTSSLFAVVFNQMFLLAAMGIGLYALLPFTQTGQLQDEVIYTRFGIRAFTAAIMFILYQVPTLFLLVSLGLAAVLMVNLLPGKDRQEIFEQLDLQVMQ